VSRTIHVPGLAALGLSLLVAGCTQCATERNREIAPVVFGIRDRLTPEKGQSLAFSGVRSDSAGVRASWEIETAMDWPAYSAWAKGRAPADFRIVAEGESSLTLGKELPGDFYSLRLSPVPATSPLRIRAEFDGRPY
jgi:hypothetical protein